MRKLTVLASALCCSLLAGARADTVPPRHFEVRMLGGNSFDPPIIEIRVGDTITWINDDENSIHTATSDDGTSFDTHNLQPLSYSKRINNFPTAGTINYHCGKHPATMTGKVVVDP